MVLKPPSAYVLKVISIVIALLFLFCSIYFIYLIKKNPCLVLTPVTPVDIVQTPVAENGVDNATEEAAITESLTLTATPSVKPVLPTRATTATPTEVTPTVSI